MYSELHQHSMGPTVAGTAFKSKTRVKTGRGVRRPPFFLVVSDIRHQW